MLQHEMMSHETHVTGDLPGHLLPGLALAAWALAWMFRFRHRSEPTAIEPVESSQVAGILKIVVAIVAIIAHIPAQTWNAMEKAMAWQHMAMFVPVALAGVADILVLRRLLEARASYAVHSFVFGNIMVLLIGHGNPDGVEATAHRLLTYTFAVAVLAFAAEMAQSAKQVRWIRAASVLGAGIWFAVTGWILYLSGWNVADPANEMLVHVAWAASMVLAVGITIGLCSRRVSANASDLAR